MKLTAAAIVTAASSKTITARKHNKRRITLVKPLLQRHSEYGIYILQSAHGRTQSDINRYQGSSSATAQIECIGGHYNVQGRSKSLMLLPIESLYATSH